MGEPAKRRATYEDVLHAPRHMVAEIIDGELSVRPRPAKPPASDRAAKLPIYARELVSHVWLVDPIQRTLEALRREGSRWLILAVYRGDEKVRAEPFDAIELELGILWADVVL
ncbi:MAG: Uma2 family endonuclease [Myxococcales bacterium]|nr:Uma2 family endonuclease [Myxococcales bacterium]